MGWDARRSEGVPQGQALPFRKLLFSIDKAGDVRKYRRCLVTDISEGPPLNRRVFVCLASGSSDCSASYKPRVTEYESLAVKVAGFNDSRPAAKILPPCFRRYRLASSTANFGRQQSGLRTTALRISETGKKIDHHASAVVGCTAMPNPPHPGPVIKQNYLAPRHLSVRLAAEHLGVSRSVLSKVLNGRGPITVNLALRLELAGCGEAMHWLRMQIAHDLPAVRAKYLPRIRVNAALLRGRKSAEVQG